MNDFFDTTTTTFYGRYLELAKTKQTTYVVVWKLVGCTQLAETSDDYQWHQAQHEPTNCVECHFTGTEI